MHLSACAAGPAQRPSSSPVRKVSRSEHTPLASMQGPDFSLRSADVTAANVSVWQGLGAALEGGREQGRVSLRVQKAVQLRQRRLWLLQLLEAPALLLPQHGALQQRLSSQQHLRCHTPDDVGSAVKGLIASAGLHAC